MSATSELHHDQISEPERPFTMDEWVALRDQCAKTAWAETGTTANYGDVWRLTDAVLRAAMPERVPEVTP